MATIDSLDVQISAQATAAVKSLDTLNGKLTTISSTLGKLNTDGLNNFANGANQLSSAMRGMKDIDDKKFGSIAKSVNKLANADTSKLYAAASGLGTLANGIKTISAVPDLKNTTSAINAIKNLVKVNLAGFDTAKMNTIASTISSFANQLSIVGGIDTKTVQLVSAMARLAGSGKHISNVAMEFPKLGNEMITLVKNMQGVDTIDANIAKLVDSFSKLANAGKKITETTANLDKFGDEIVNLLRKLQSAPAISANLASTIQGLGNMATSTGSGIRNLSGFLNTYSTSAGTAKKKSVSLASAIGKVYAAYWLLFRALNKIWDSIDYSSQLTEVQNVVDNTFGIYSDALEEMSKTSIQDLGMSALTVKKTASTFQAMGKNIGFSQDAMTEMSLSLTQLTADMASFYDVEQSDVAEDLQSIFTGTSKPLRQYGLDLTEATLKEYALSKGMNADISSMTQLEKVQLRYAYVMDKTSGVQGDFARTSNTWANQIRILKQNFIELGNVIGRTFIGALKSVVSVLNTAMSYVISFATVISNALGQIFGWEYDKPSGGLSSDYEDAEDAASSLADDTADAADSAKKLKQNLLGIDELNVYDADSDTGTTSGTSGTGTTAVSDISGGTWTTAESIFDYFKSEIKDLETLGETISNSLVNAMQKIDWPSIYEKARNFGSGLATFLNGLISPELFGTTATTIASSLNTALYSLNSFGTTFDWVNFGESIAAGINNFFATYDFAELANTIDTWVQGRATALITAIKEVDWDSVYDSIKEFIENIDIETVAIVIGALTIKKILKLSGLKLVSSFVTKKITSLFAKGLAIELPGITVFGTEVLSGSLWQNLLAIAGVIGGATVAVLAFFDMWQEGWSILSEILKDIGLAVLAVGAIVIGVPAGIAIGIAAAVAVISTIVIAVKDHISEIEDFISDFIRVSKEVLKELIDGVVSIFAGAISLVEKAWKGIVKFFKNLWVGISDVFSDVKNWFGEKFESAYTAVTNAFSLIGEWFSEKWKSIQDVFSGVKTWFKEKFESAYKAVTNAFSSIGTWFQNKWDIIAGVFANTKEFFKEKFESAYTTVKSAFSSIGTWFSDRWNDVTGVFSNVSGFFKNAFDSAYQAVKDSFSNIGTFFRGVANKIVSPIESAVNGVINGLNWILKQFGSNTELGSWTAPAFAKGTGGLSHDTIGVVNDQKGQTYKEMIVPPNGEPFIPEGRNVMLPLEKGTKIMPANQTKMFLNGMPHFASGIGDILGSAWSKLKDFTGNIMDYITDPGKIIQIAIDKFVDSNGWAGVMLDMASGAITTMFDSAKSWLQGIFDKEMTVSYDPTAGVEQWRGLAKKALEITGQYTESNLSALLQQMNHESSGNPNAINDWDINAINGTPSKGLMQVIDSTFKAYALDGYNTNIYDPLSNMIAAIRYTVSRYGSLYKGWTARGYIGYAGGIGNINLADLIPKYSTGGYPEDGLFMANNRELIGQFSNGKNVVANNEQITTGIEEAAYRGFSRAMSENTTQETLMKELISAVKEGKRITIDGRELVSAYDNRKSRNGFSFG